MARKLSNDALLVLASLPRQPDCCSKPDLATEIFGTADNHSIGRIKIALREIVAYLYVETNSSWPPRQKDRYGVRAELWQSRLAEFKGVDLAAMMEAARSIAPPDARQGD